MPRAARARQDDPRRVVMLPSITDAAECRAAIVISGSHGGTLAAGLAAAKHPRAVILHDAGIGLAGAGVEGLDLLDAAGIPACCVSHETARIGDPDDMLARGSLSTVNTQARLLGVQPGMSAAAAVELLTAAVWAPRSVPPTVPGARHVLRIDGGRRSLVLADSASLVDPAADAGAVVVTGSHGGLVGGDQAYGLKARAFAAVFNDAGGGVDDAGFMRLAVFDREGVPAATVSARSARIGDATSSLAGRVSHTNRTAVNWGLRPGDLLAPVIFSWLSQ